MYKNVHSSFIHNSPMLKATHCPTIVEWINYSIQTQYNTTKQLNIFFKATVIHSNFDWISKHLKEARQKRSFTVWFHLHKILRQTNLIYGDGDQESSYPGQDGDGEGSYVIGRVQRSLLDAEILLILIRVVILWMYMYKKLTICTLTICAVYSL